MIRDIVYTPGETVTFGGFNLPPSVTTCDPVYNVPTHPLWRVAYSYRGYTTENPDFFLEPDVCPGAGKEFRVGECSDGCPDDQSRGQLVVVDTSEPFALDWTLDWTMGGDAPGFDDPNELKVFEVSIYRDDDPMQNIRWLTDPFRLIPGCSSVILQSVKYLGGNRFKLDWPGQYLVWIERDLHGNNNWETIEIGYFGSDYIDTVPTLANPEPRWRIRRICEIGLDIEYSIESIRSSAAAWQNNHGKRPFHMKR